MQQKVTKKLMWNKKPRAKTLFNRFMSRKMKNESFRQNSLRRG